MKKNFPKVQISFLVVICAFIVTIAFGQNGTGKLTTPTTDTLPRKERKVINVDEALADLELSKAEIEKAMKEIDWQKMQKEIQESIREANVDMAKMKVEIEKAMKEVDAEKIKADVQNALKEIDAAKIQAEVQKALKEIDVEKMKKEIQESVAKIDVEKIKIELEKMKETDFSKMQEELKKMQPQIEQNMKDAKVHIEKAQKEMADYKKFIDALDSDRLINKNENYLIEYKNGELFLNGKKASPDVVNKFSSFLKGREDFEIKKNN